MKFDFIKRVLVIGVNTPHRKADTPVRRPNALGGQECPPYAARGVALIITLIMLSVITIMAVAFLSLSRRERFAVASASEQTDAVLSAEAGQQKALSEIVARVKAHTNWLAADLLVSRNLINPGGFISGVSHPTNVNYDFRSGGGPLNRDDLLQNITNLLIDARVPVFVDTNKAGSAGPLDFRFYVDLNRNRRFDTNGFFIPFDESRNIIGVNPEFHVGDPEWISLFERPTLNHSSSNRAFGRYAYLVQPIGKSLDLNFIHNQAKNSFALTAAANPPASGYHRNQGCGSWEINLAAFLTTLNTNLWPGPDGPLAGTRYRYVPKTNNSETANQGYAFTDAAELLRFRYNGRQANLYGARQILPFAVWQDFLLDQVDLYANSSNAAYGLAFTGDNDDDPALPWPGACNTPSNHFFTVHDFLRGPAAYTNAYPNFLTRMNSLSRSNSSHARHTFYRMIEQLGTDSAPEPEWAEVRKLRDKMGATNAWDFPAEPIGRFNLNYDNIFDPDNPTNALSQPLEYNRNKFFTNLANVLIRSQFDFGITNIPVYPTNWYTPEVHRLLQLAANILDATSPLPNGFPSVFRPNVGPDPSNPSGYAIVGFEFDNEKQSLVNSLRTNIFGIPFVIGAKKGIPNFNEYVVQTTALGARKLEVVRGQTPGAYVTNQMFVLGISNFFGLEAWNSYTNALNTNFPSLSEVTMEIGIVADFAVTNSEPPSGLYYTNRVVFGMITNILTADWEGFRPGGSQNDGGFKVPIFTNVMLLTNSAYLSQPPHFEPVHFEKFDVAAGFPAPEWTYAISNRLTYILHSGGQVLDFVYLDRLTNTVNLSELFMGPNRAGPEPDGLTGVWNTNRLGGAPATARTVPTIGIDRQLRISVGDVTLGPTDWESFAFSRPANVNVEIGKFRAFLRLPPRTGFDAPTNNTDSKFQAPFSPARRIVRTINWQVNDPLVHYMPEHLTDRDPTNNITTHYVRPFTDPVLFPTNLNALNLRYRPWRGNPQKDPKEDPLALHLGVKDPGVFKSDDWDFPTNKFPNIGWLGRVHRGTPWQTVYMKADVATEDAWREHVWDPRLRSHPTNDWQLIDMFTVAVHPNASKGQLSINQTNEAAWAAVLSGVLTLTNHQPVDPLVASSGARTNLGNAAIEPGSPQLRAIVDGINRKRAQMEGQVFHRLGDILQVPELSVLQTNIGGQLMVVNQFLTPYLDLSKADAANDFEYGINDTAYERIPQQILSLLRVGDPRYVIYAFGQSLKPADRSIVTSGDYFGVCTNYQITGEVVTRSVVRLEGDMKSPRAVIEAFNVVPID